MTGRIVSHACSSCAAGLVVVYLTSRVPPRVKSSRQPQQGSSHPTYPYGVARQPQLAVITAGQSEAKHVAPPATYTRYIYVILAKQCLKYVVNESLCWLLAPGPEYYLIVFVGPFSHLNLMGSLRLCRVSDNELTAYGLTVLLQELEEHQCLITEWSQLLCNYD